MTTAQTIENEPQQACPNCGDPVPPGGRGLGRQFCAAKCRGAWNRRQKARGSVLAPLVLAWLETRHAAPGTEAHEVCRIARREITDIGRIFREEDRDASRPPVWKHARRLLIDQGSRYQDRRQR